MTTEPFVVTPSDSFARAAEIMRDLDVGIVAVVDDTAALHLLGVITDRDIAVRCVSKEHGPDCTVEQHMSGRGLRTVRADDEADAVVALMARKQLRRIPVVADDNRLLGIIAQGDVAIKLPRAEWHAAEHVLQANRERRRSRKHRSAGGTKESGALERAPLVHHITTA